MRKLTPHHKKAALCSVAQFKLARAVRWDPSSVSRGSRTPRGGNQPMTCQRHAHGGNCARTGCELLPMLRATCWCLALRACHAVTAEALVCSAERRWARLPGTIGRVYMLMVECGSDCGPTQVVVPPGCFPGGSFFVDTPAVGGAPGLAQPARAWVAPREGEFCDDCLFRRSSSPPPHLSARVWVYLFALTDAAAVGLAACALDRVCASLLDAGMDRSDDAWRAGQFSSAAKPCAVPHSSHCPDRLRLRTTERPQRAPDHREPQSSDFQRIGYGHNCLCAGNCGNAPRMKIDRVKLLQLEGHTCPILIEPRYSSTKVVTRICGAGAGAGAGQDERLEFRLGAAVPELGPGPRLDVLTRLCELEPLGRLLRPVFRPSPLPCS